MAASLVTALALVVEPHRVDASAPHLRVRGDAAAYARMVQGEEVGAPFRYRVAVPALARLLPLPPLEALRALSVAFTAVGFTLLWMALRALGIGWVPASSALVSVGVALPQLSLFHNPYLTDAAGWMIVCAVVLAVVRRRFWTFAAWVVAGMAIREATLFVAPAWLAIERRRGWMVVLVAAAAGLVLQHWIGFRPHPPRPVPFSLLRMVGDAAVAWHGLWIVGVAGLLQVRQPARRSLLWLGLLAVLGATLASIVATDTTRMFLMVGPLIAVGAAQAMAVLHARRSLSAWALSAACLAATVIWVPVVGSVGERMGPAWRPWRAVAIAGLLLSALACVRALRTGVQASNHQPGRGAPPVF